MAGRTGHVSLLHRSAVASLFTDEGTLVSLSISLGLERALFALFTNIVCYIMLCTFVIAINFIQSASQN